MSTLSAGVLLFLIMDPVGNIPLFLSVLKNVAPDRRMFVIVREMMIDLARPRPLALGEAPELEEHVQAIYGLFEEMGVLHGKSAGVRGARSAR